MMFYTLEPPLDSMTPFLEMWVIRLFEGWGAGYLSRWKSQGYPHLFLSSALQLLFQGQ